MPQDRSQLWRYIAVATSFGFTVLASIGVCYWLGTLVDARFGTRPIFALAGILVGVGAAFYSLVAGFDLLQRRK